jgi:hypothetical protein
VLLARAPVRKRTLDRVDGEPGAICPGLRRSCPKADPCGSNGKAASDSSLSGDISAASAQYSSAVKSLVNCLSARHASAVARQHGATTTSHRLLIFIRERRELLCGRRRGWGTAATRGDPRPEPNSVDSGVERLLRESRVASEEAIAGTSSGARLLGSERTTPRQKLLPGQTESFVRPRGGRQGQQKVSLSTSV